MALELIPSLSKMLNYLVGRILVASGACFLTFGGYALALNQLKDILTDNIKGLSSDAFNLFLLAGGGEVVGILLGAYTFIITLKSISRLSFIQPKGD